MPPPSTGRRDLSGSAEASPELRPIFSPGLKLRSSPPDRVNAAFLERKETERPVRRTTKLLICLAPASILQVALCGCGSAPSPLLTTSSALSQAHASVWLAQTPIDRWPRDLAHVQARGLAAVPPGM